MSSRWVYLNGEFLPESQAKISPFDRGFLFGDGVYEVIAVYGGKPFHLDLHLNRMKYSLEAIGIAPPLTDTEWIKIIDTLIEKSELRDLALYLHISRGTQSPRNFLIEPNINPTVFASVQPFKLKTHPDEYQPIRAITREDIRWKRCDIKSTGLLASVLLINEAKKMGASEVILLRDGFVTEGTSTNVFIIKNSTLVTPPLDKNLLSGTTRLWVLEKAAECGIPTQEKPISLNQLLEADEVWVSSTSRDITPVTQINDKPVAEGKIGPLWQQLISLLLKDRT